MIIFTDRVIEKLDAFIGRHDPERGGALMALPESNLVVDFIADPDGEMTGSSYVPSPALTQRVQEAERQEGLAFCGVVHSHPGSFNQPSGQDDLAFRKGLDINPHLARFIAPIITVDGPAEPGSRFQRTIGRCARMTCYVAYRSTARSAEPTSFWPRRRTAGNSATVDDFGVRPAATTEIDRLDCRSDQETRKSEPQALTPGREDHVVRDTSGQVRLLRAAMDVMPVKAEIEALRARLERKIDRPVHAREGPIIELGGVSCLSESITFDGGDVMVIVPPTFPFTAPIIVEGTGTDSHEIEFHWKIDYGTHAESLANALIDHLGGVESWRST